MVSNCCNRQLFNSGHAAARPSTRRTALPVATSASLSFWMFSLGVIFPTRFAGPPVVRVCRDLGFPFWLKGNSSSERSLRRLDSVWRRPNGRRWSPFVLASAAIPVAGGAMGGCVHRGDLGDCARAVSCATCRLSTAVAHRFQTLSRMRDGRCVQTDVRRRVGRSGHGIRHGHMHRGDGQLRNPNQLRHPGCGSEADDALTFKADPSRGPIRLVQSAQKVTICENSSYYRLGRSPQWWPDRGGLLKFARLV